MPAPDLFSEADQIQSLLDDFSNTLVDLPIERRNQIEGSLQKIKSYVNGLIQTIAQTRHQEIELNQENPTGALFFNHLHEAALIYEVIRDEAGNIVDWFYRDANIAALQELGLKRDELIGKTASELFGTETVDRVAPEIKQVLITGEPCQHEENFANKNFLVSMFRINENTIARLATDITERKEVEAKLRLINEALAASEVGYKELAESINDGFMELDRDWRFSYVNHRAASNAGLTPANLIGKNIWECYPALLGTSSEQYYRQAMEKRQPSGFEMAGVYSDKWYQIRVYPSAKGITIFWIDITERKHSEEALLKAHERAAWMARFPDENPNPVARVSTDGIILYRNRASAELPGWHFQEGHPLPDPFISMLKQANAQGKQVGQDVQIGEKFYSITLMPFPSDQYANLYGLDITERKRAEAVMRESEARFRALISASAQVLYQMSPDWNEMRQLQGGSFLADTAEPNRNWMAGYIHPDDQAWVREVIENAVRTGTVFEVEYRILRADGTSGWTASRAVPVRNAAGEIIEWFGAASNITDRKQAEEALRESEAAQQRSAANERARANELEAVMDAAPAIIWISRDPECHEMFGNRYSYDFLNIRQGENVSKTAPESKLANQHYHMERDGYSIPASELPMQIAAATGKPAQDYAFDLVYEDGTVLHLFGNVNPLLAPDGKPYGAIGVFVDLTALRHLEKEKIAAKAEIEVQRRLMDQREQERQSIARDLHDGPIQTLSSTTFHLQMIKDIFSDPGLNVELNQIGMDIKTSIQELRGVLYDLRPPVLMHFGFSRVIQRYTADLRERFPEIEIEMDVEDDNRLLSDQSRLALFRIYQAGLNNIVRHSGATKAWVVYKIQQESFYLELRDNGKGFEVSNDFTLLTQEGHFGLVGMRERTEAIGGQFFVTSELGKGSSIIVKGPLRGKN